MEKYKNIVKEYNEKYSKYLHELRLPGDTLKDEIIYGILLNLGTRNDRLLEVGCGVGHTSNKLSKLTEVVGVDLSEKAIEIASKSSRAYFVRADIQILPFRDNSFKYAVAKDVLEHVLDDDSALRELNRVCKDNGILIIYVPHVLHPVNFSAESLVKKLVGYTIDPSASHLRRYSLFEVVKKLERNQFSTLAVWYFSHFALSLITLVGVISYDLFLRKRKNITRTGLFLIKLMFNIFEKLGMFEEKVFKNLPGAGLFGIAKNKKSK
ncbi:MAG: class I SAM-dependent methyltransferase [Candidatus Methanomethylicia archaeon]